MNILCRLALPYTGKPHKSTRGEEPTSRKIARERGTACQLCDDGTDIGKDADCNHNPPGYDKPLYFRRVNDEAVRGKERTFDTPDRGPEQNDNHELAAEVQICVFGEVRPVDIRNRAATGKGQKTVHWLHDWYIDTSVVLLAPLL